MEPYVQDHEWNGFSVRRTRRGWLVSGWSREQGALTDWAYLCPPDAITDPAAPWNDGMSQGQYLAAMASDIGRCLRRGREVR